ncbi:MAG: phage major capsid protein [Desulfobacteraceae bacterium]|jgi:HK97 family phage major capsid protein
MSLKDIAKLRNDLHVKVEELRTLYETIESREDKKPTESEKETLNSLRDEITNREDEIATVEIIQRDELATQQKNDYEKDIENSEFRNFGHFVQSAWEGRIDKSQETERRDLLMGDGPSAGFLVPDVFGGQLKALDPMENVVRPRAQYLGGGSDATVVFNSLDQSGSLGVYGGVTVNWINETAAVPDAGDMKFKQIKLEPKIASGYVDISRKLMNNASEISDYIQTQLQLAMRGSEDQKFCSGSGVGCPLGFIGHASSIEVSRNTAADFKYADISSMYSKVKFNARLVWVINPSVLPKLLNMVDGVGNLIWQPNARDGKPTSLLGIPVIYSDVLPVLGTKGDVCLVDLYYYGVRDGSPMFILFDPYSQSGTALIRIYLFWNVDGQPMLTSPLLLEDSTTTLSPFVVLK